MKPYEIVTETDGEIRCYIFEAESAAHAREIFVGDGGEILSISQFNQYEQ